jgi:hypothetical protein
LPVPQEPVVAILLLLLLLLATCLFLLLVIKRSESHLNYASHPCQKII